ncbi:MULTISPECIES: DMT family transporter [Bhargavaea]|uniref:DMT family transporter n=1 Tax=Bhargavaea changchunensis TaxID=2134037 RepID=A0ABW2NE17_9BACL|nr:SMR family transporter [Bhargavaea sp. CC-171006]
MKNAWFYVILTCIFELLWVYGFSMADRWWHWALILGIIITDFHFLAKACEKLPTGTVYAVFAAAGAVGTVVMDVYLFGGTMNEAKLFFILLLVAGVISLKMADKKEEKGVNA